MSVRALIGLVAATLLTSAAIADSRVVDPTKVAPEYREAAEKRAAEQRKLNDCHKQAAALKIIPRDRTKFLINCIEK